MKTNLRRLALLACGALFLFSSGMLARDWIRSSRERTANCSLARQVQSARDAARASAEEEGWLDPFQVETPWDLLAQYQALAEENSDMAGWLWIEDTGIDYPVMHTPGAPEYYLRRGFDKTYAVSGSLFLDAECRPEGECALIYGHRMNDSSMFGDLDQYQTLEYAQAHPVIRFDTLEELRIYEVMGAFFSRVYRVNEKGGFRYYQYTDLSDPAVFAEFTAQVRDASLYDTGVEAVYGDRILILSTCSYHTQDGRFVVVARQRTES